MLPKPTRFAPSSLSTSMYASFSSAIPTRRPFESVSQTMASPLLSALSTVFNASSTFSSISRVSSFGVCTTRMRTSMETIPSRSRVWLSVRSRLAIVLCCNRRRGGAGTLGTFESIEAAVVTRGGPLLGVHPLVHDDPDAEEAEQLTGDPEQPRAGALVGEL